MSLVVMMMMMMMMIAVSFWYLAVCNVRRGRYMCVIDNVMIARPMKVNGWRAIDVGS